MDKPMIEFSVLMSVYNKENPDFLSRALNSVVSQTKKPKEIVLVRDGTLTDGLDSAIEDFVNKNKEKIQINVIDNNGKHGLGNALNVGLRFCNYEWVARMDSDDICVSQRFEKQSLFIETHPDLQIVGGAIEEFEGNESNITGTRSAPIGQKQISNFARLRNPVNHVTVAFRKSFIESLGGYRENSGFEDYDLWLRALHILPGCIGNQDDILVRVRTTGFIDRRGGMTYIKHNTAVRNAWRREGLISFFPWLVAVTALNVIYGLPSRVLKWIYSAILRS